MPKKRRNKKEKMREKIFSICVFIIIALSLYLLQNSSLYASVMGNNNITEITNLVLDQNKLQVLYLDVGQRR